MSFIPWIEDNNVNATQDYNTYLNDSQRKEGFKGGTPASAIRVNTALRQANLVATALMKALNVSETLNYRSSITDVQNAIVNGIKATKVNNASNADVATAAVYTEQNRKDTIESRLSALQSKWKISSVNTVKEFHDVIKARSNEGYSLLFVDVQFANVVNTAADSINFTYNQDGSGNVTLKAIDPIPDYNFSINGTIRFFAMNKCAFSYGLLARYDEGYLSLDIADSSPDYIALRFERHGKSMMADGGTAGGKMFSRYLEWQLTSSQFRGCRMVFVNYAWQNYVFG